MEKVYKGFQISQVGVAVKYFKDWYVHPVGKENETELWEDMTIDQVESMIDQIVN